MTTITIPLSEEHFERLRARALECDVAPEELLRSCVEEWLARSREDFAAAAQRVLDKNAELYRRLA